METITTSKLVDAPVSAVWASWHDFGNIHRFSPEVSSSRLLSDDHLATGIGTRRECELIDGKNWLRERIVGFEEKQNLRIEVYESSLPVSSMNSTVGFTETSQGGTEVTVTCEFEAAKGIVGKIKTPLLRRRLRLVLEALLEQNRVYVEQNDCFRKAA